MSVAARNHRKSAPGMSPGATEVLGEVRRRAGAVRRARDAYRGALVAAVDELEQAGDPQPFARVAAAAGVSKQAVRSLVTKARAA